MPATTIEQIQENLLLIFISIVGKLSTNKKSLILKLLMYIKQEYTKSYWLVVKNSATDFYSS